MSRIIVTLGWQVSLLMKNVSLDAISMILNKVGPLNFADIKVQNTDVTTLLKLSLDSHC